jgi:CheY-like chemotaxis protein
MPELHLVTAGPDGPEGQDQAAFVLTCFPCVLGRGRDCDHRLDDPRVSRRHCEFSLRGGRVWAEDLGSRNGTSLNGEPLVGARPLGDGDRLDLAYSPFRVRLVGVPEGAAAEAPEPHRVLVVEDDATTAEAMALLLESWGHEVHLALDGPEALRAAKERPPDTVFLDIRLPGMCGVEVARRLRRDAGLVRARLVALTGDEGAAEALRSRGRFAQLLVKPVSAQALRDALAQPG